MSVKALWDRRELPESLQLPKESKLTSSGSSEPCLLAGGRCGRRRECGKISSSSCRPFLTRDHRQANTEVCADSREGSQCLLAVPHLLTTDRLTRQQDQLAYEK